MATVLRYREPTALSAHGWDATVREVAAIAARNVAIVSRLVEQPRWRARFEQRVVELRTLRRGWDGYEADPLDPSILTFARSVLNSVMAAHTPAPSVVPTHGGSLQLEWHLGGCEIELMIYRPYEAELSATFADGRDPIEDEPLSTDFDVLSTALGATS